MSGKSVARDGNPIRPTPTTAYYNPTFISVKFFAQKNPTDDEPRGRGLDGASIRLESPIIARYTARGRE